MNMLVRSLFILIILWVSLVQSEEFSESFVVQVYHDHIKVLAPKKFVNEVHISVENKTLKRMIGRLDVSHGRIVKNFTVSSHGHHVIKVKINKADKLMLVPLSPAFQSAELIFGQRAYEVPSQR